MKISLTTTCQNRLAHLQETLTANMRDNQPSPGVDVEFVVLDYNDNEGVQEWIKTDPMMIDAMQSGRLRYARNNADVKFHMSHAKNMATRLATGDVVCNIDADNFTGKDFTQYIAHVMNEDSQSVVSPSNKMISKLGGGMGGRIAITAENFARLGGYDERFKGWGSEDTDFVRRAKGLGLHHYRIVDENRLVAIGHDNLSRIKNMFDEAQWGEQVKKVEDQKKQWTTLHKARYVFSVMARGVQVNHGGEFGMGEVTVGMNDQPMVLGPVPVERISPAYISALHFPEFVIGRIKPELRNIMSVEGEGHEGDAFIPRHI